MRINSLLDVLSFGGLNSFGKLALKRVNLEKLIQDLIRAQKFDLGDTNTYPYIIAPTPECMNLPASPCYFEFFSSERKVYTAIMMYAPTLRETEILMAADIENESKHISNYTVSRVIGVGRIFEQFIDNLKWVMLPAYFALVAINGEIETGLHQSYKIMLSFDMDNNSLEEEITKAVKTEMTHFNAKLISALHHYSYHILRIPGDLTERISLGGTHASPRFHFRRGHVRKLPEGNFTWVKYCMVGNPELGSVDKEYRTNV